MFDDSSRYWTPEQTAKYLGVKPHTLAVWRSARRYSLPFVSVGRLIRYDSRAVEKWMASRTVGTAAEAAE
ncbi:MAG: helix-turn-helix domain-containing protein [Planctomycetota bacterium]|nr:helix-turn-helix domain-containing protein [Planctomycetota bacterium]